MSLDSLKSQSLQIFEVVFIDYGSDDDIASQIELLLDNYPFVRHIFSNSRGWFWNRAHALNLGIKEAKGEILIFSDIDLIISSSFLQNLSRFSFEKNFYTFSCYYLPPEKVEFNPVNGDVKGYPVSYVGLCAVSKKAVDQIAGYDQYFMDWGGEDDDFYYRLEKAGFNRRQMTIEEFPVYHQWHKTQAPAFPSPWYLEMVRYLYARQSEKKKSYQDYYTEATRLKRTIPERLKQSGKFRQFDLFPNPLFQFNLFLDEFYRMEGGEFGVLIYVESKVDTPMRGRKQAVMRKMNHLMQRINWPFSVEATDKAVPVHDKTVFYNFILHFVGVNRESLRDYYFHSANGKMEFFLQKK